MPNNVPAVRCTKARHSSMRTSSLSASVSWRTLMTCIQDTHAIVPADPLFPLPFHYVMARTVPAHARSSTLYGRSQQQQQQPLFMCQI